MNTKHKTIVVLMVVMMVSAVVAPMVMADDIPTVGVVNGGANPPEVWYKWELPDDADAPNHLTDGTQILPVADANKPVELYMIATDPNGIYDIQNFGFRIAHPAVPDPVPCWMDEVDPRWNYGDVQNFKFDEGTADEWWWDDPDEQLLILAALNGAIAANLLEYEEVYGAFPNDPNAIVELLDQYEVRFFWAVKDFTCCYAPGYYEVKAWATDISGSEGALINDLYYDSLIAIELDFGAGVNYGELTPAVAQTVQGDVDMGTAGAPTVHSGANDPIQIWLRTSPMVGVEKGDQILDFDARLNQFDRVYFVADEDVPVTGVLRPNWEEKMDFSVWPPWGTPEDTYEGTMTLWISHYECP